MGAFFFNDARSRYSINTRIIMLEGSIFSVVLLPKDIQLHQDITGAEETDFTLFGCWYMFCPSIQTALQEHRQSCLCLRP